MEQRKQIKSRLFLKQHPKCNSILPLGFNFSIVCSFSTLVQFVWFNVLILILQTNKIFRQNFCICRHYVIPRTALKVGALMAEIQEHSNQRLSNSIFLKRKTKTFAKIAKTNLRQLIQQF